MIIKILCYIGLHKYILKKSIRCELEGWDLYECEYCKNKIRRLFINK